MGGRSPTARTAASDFSGDATVEEQDVLDGMPADLTLEAFEKKENGHEGEAADTKTREVFDEEERSGGKPTTCQSGEELKTVIGAADPKGCLCADKLGEVDEPSNIKGEKANKELLQAGANTFTKITVPYLKGDLAAVRLGEVDEPSNTKREKADKELLEAGANTSTKITVPYLKGDLTPGKVDKPLKTKAVSAITNGEEPEGSSDPSSKEAFKVKKEAYKCEAIKVENKGGPDLGANRCLLKDDKFDEEREAGANPSAKVTVPNQFEEERGKCGERGLLVNAGKEDGLEMKAGVEGPVVQSASSTSADPDIDDVAARSRAAFRIKILEHKDGHKRSSTVQDSVNDLRKLMSKVELLQERRDASRAQDPNPDLTRAQNAEDAATVFNTDNLFLPRFSTRIRELPAPQVRCVVRLAITLLPGKKVAWDGYFAVPSNAVTGVPDIDSRNERIAELYGCVSHLLHCDHHKYITDFLVGPVKPEVKEQLKENIGQIRTKCRELREEVISLGGRPLNEPMDYWRTKYYNADLL